MTAFVDNRNGTPSVEIPRRDVINSSLSSAVLGRKLYNDEISGRCYVLCARPEDAQHVCVKVNQLLAGNSLPPASSVAAKAVTYTIGGVTRSASSYVNATVSAAGSESRVIFTDEQRKYFLAREFHWLEDEDFQKASRIAKLFLNKAKQVSALNLLNGDTDRSLLSDKDVADFVRDVFGLEVTVTIKGAADVGIGDNQDVGETDVHT